MTNRVPKDSELLEVLGEEALTSLAERFGGTRLYLPCKMKSDHDIAIAIGFEAAQKLAARFAPDVIRVPVFRLQRALRLRSQGLSDSRIAVALGLTEAGVNRLFQRFKQRGGTLPPKPKITPFQATVHKGAYRVQAFYQSQLYSYRHGFGAGRWRA